MNWVMPVIEDYRYTVMKVWVRGIQRMKRQWKMEVHISLRFLVSFV